MAEIALSVPRPTPLTRLARLWEASALGLILLVGLGLRLWNLDAYTGSFDEGIRSQQLLLMSAGYRPFRDIFASQGPLLLDVLYPFFVLFGETLATARAGVVVFSIVGLIGAWWVGRLVAGPVAGLAAAGLLALSPTYLEGSRLALAEVPTIAPALLAIGAALAYRETGRRGWLLASAALCAAALLIKPMVIHLGVPLLVLLAVSSPTPRRTESTWLGSGRNLADLGLYAVVVAGLSGLVVLALGPIQVWDNLGAYRSGAGHQLGADWAQNLRLTALTLRREGLGFFALALVGILLGSRWRPSLVLPIVLWSGAVLGLFLLYGDLADKHIVYLVPPLALLAGIGVGLSLERGRLFLGPAPRLAPSLVLLVGLAAIGLYIWGLPAIYRADLYVLNGAEEVAERRRDLGAELDMAEVIRTRAGPNDWVLADNPNAAFRARRLVIPSLVDTSGTRVDAGSLTSAVAIDAVDRYRPVVIITWARRLGRLDELTRWLPEAGYRLDRTYDNGWRLYVKD